MMTTIRRLLSPALRRYEMHVLVAAALAVLCASTLRGGIALAADTAIPPEIQAIIDSPDRSQADRDTDKRRHPAELLAFSGAKPGMAVFDFGTGRGYTAELLARVVGPKGSVVAQNDPIVFDKFLKGQWDPRFGSAAMKNVKPVVRASDDPVPPGSGPFDLITAIYMYHDTVWMGRDRKAMNQAFLNALKPGGQLILVDHAGSPGTGSTQTDTLHRIEESVVKTELEAAGFKLVDEAQFLRNPNDPRDAPFFKSTVPVDGFVLKYVKP
jgi:predicted methyltransferase